MKCSIDIPYEALKEAMALIEEKRGVCPFLPSARFIMADWHNDFVFSTLVCSTKMEGKRTGVGAQYCTNCLRDSEFIEKGDKDE